MACDYLGEFMEIMEEIGASCYTECFVSGDINKCEFVRLPFERRAHDEVFYRWL
jgi:hypothetical protein